MRTADCSNCGRAHAPADLNSDNVCPDCAQFARETEQEPRRQAERAASTGVIYRG